MVCARPPERTLTVAGAPVSPRATLQAREPDVRPASAPGSGVLGEMNSTSSTSSLSSSSFLLSGLRDCCFCETCRSRVSGCGQLPKRLLGEWSLGMPLHHTVSGERLTLTLTRTGGENMHAPHTQSQG